MNILRTEYQIENNHPVVYQFTRNTVGCRKITKDKTLVPYFYVPLNEVSNVKGMPHDTRPYKTVDGTFVAKVYCNTPEEVPMFRERFSKTWEADILFPSRFLIDNVDTLDKTPYKVMYTDIETDNTGRVPKPERAEEEIVCIGAYDNMENTYTTFLFRPDLVPGCATSLFKDELHTIRHYKSEVDMLVDFIKYFRESEPDVVTGWNILKFDLVYILTRLRNLGINPNEISPMRSAYMKGVDPIIKGVALVDLYDVYKKVIPNLELSYKLDYIANKVVGERKVNIDNEIKWLWKMDINKLILYNTTDVYLVKAIDQKMGLTSFVDELRRLNFCQFEDTLVQSKSVDSYLLKLFHNRTIFPTKSKDNPPAGIEGALVKSFAKGIYNNMIAFDVSSMYPSIISSFNLSLETVHKNRLTPSDIELDGIFVRHDIKGVIPEMVEHLKGERLKYKDMMKKYPRDSTEWKIYDGRQYALKIMMNAIYGQSCYTHSRIYNPLVGRLITYCGRTIISEGMRILESLGYKVIYIDTDSLFWEYPDSEVDLDKVNSILDYVNLEINHFIETKMKVK